MAVSEELRIPDVPSRASGVQATGDLAHEVQGWLQPFKGGLFLVNPPTHTMSWCRSLETHRRVFKVKAGWQKSARAGCSAT